MALVFCDGFDSYDATADLIKKWARADTPWAWSAAVDQNGATGGIVTVATTGGVYLSPPANIFGVSTRAGLGFWLKVSAAPAAIADIVYLYDISGSAVGRIRITTSGFLQLTTGIATVLLTGATNACDNVWHWVEIAAQIGTTVLQRGILDSTSQWNGNATMASVSSINRFAFVSIASRTVSISDVIAYDNTGTFTVATDFPLTARKITTVRPNGDDAVQFTRSTGATSFSLVDEIDADMSDYVESDTVGQQDTYDYAALGFTPTTVNAVMVSSYLIASSTGAINHQQVAKSGGTTTVGATVMVPPAVRVVQQPFYVDPNTSTAWTESGINAAKFGIKVV